MASDPFTCHAGTCYEVETSSSEPFSFFSAGEDGTVRWYDLRLKSSCQKQNCTEDVLINLQRAVTTMDLHPTIPYEIAVGCSDSSVRGFDRRMLGTMATGSDTGRGIQGMIYNFCAPGLSGRQRRITSLKHSPNGDEMLVSYSTDNIYLFNFKDSSHSREFCAYLDNQKAEKKAGIMRNIQRLRDNRSSRRSSPVVPDPRLVTSRSPYLLVTDVVASASPPASEPQPSSQVDTSQVDTSQGDTSQGDTFQEPEPSTSTGVSSRSGTTTSEAPLPPSERDPVARPPFKRLRLRGDWSDTGPNARPESERNSSPGLETTEEAESAFQTNFMRRMSDMFTRWLEHPTGASSSEPAEPSEQSQALQQVAQSVSADPSVPATAGASTSLVEPSPPPEYRSNFNTVQISNSDFLNVIPQSVEDADAVDSNHRPGSSSLTNSFSPMAMVRLSLKKRGSEASTVEMIPNDPAVSNKRPVSSLEFSSEDSSEDSSQTEEGAEQMSLLEAEEINSSKVEISEGASVEPLAATELVEDAPGLLSEDEGIEERRLTTKQRRKDIEKSHRGTVHSDVEDEGDTDDTTLGLAGGGHHGLEGSPPSCSAAASRRAVAAAQHIQRFYRRKQALSKVLTSDDEDDAPKDDSLTSPGVKMVFKGHRNARTMIKEANFWGDHFIMSGSDCGHIFFWDKYTGEVVNLLEADKHVVNCLQPHPEFPILASSGIDYDIKIWAPVKLEPEFDILRANEVMKRNRVMLEETKDTVTVPASFMLRMLASLNQMRGGGRRGRARLSSSRSSGGDRDLQGRVTRSNRTVSRSPDTDTDSD